MAVGQIISRAIATGAIGAEYRQALRDITLTYDSLEGVEWPTPPA